MCICQKILKNLLDSHNHATTHTVIQCYQKEKWAGERLETPPPGEGIISTDCVHTTRHTSTLTDTLDGRHYLGKAL